MAIRGARRSRATRHNLPCAGGYAPDDRAADVDRLRTRERGDQVDGAVTTAIYSGETEVVQQGALVHGAVTETRPRTKRKAPDFALRNHHSDLLTGIDVVLGR